METRLPAAPSGSIELLPGRPFCSIDDLNRIARQQGLCLAIAQAWVLDEIHKVVPLSTASEHALIRTYLKDQGITNDDALERYLQRKGWDHDDLTYFATKGYRVQLFKQQVFQQDIELRFLENKLDRDQVTYSLIRVQDENLAFELHQRLLEGEADFADLAPTYSTGPERSSDGQIGPVPLSQAHPVVAEKLRISEPGQLWPPFYLVNIWLILRLDQREGAQLDEACRSELLDELFDGWMSERVMLLLAGDTPAPLPLHLLNTVPG